MSNAIDYNIVLRDACVLALTQHIKARLIQTGCVLLRGSHEGHAKFLVSRWNDSNVRVFYVLAKANGRFYSHTQLAKEANSTPKATRDYWARTLKGSCVAARLSDTTERRSVRLFRRGHEMFFSAHGIKLQLDARMLDFDLARVVTDSTMGQTAALRQNYEGACEAQESDASKDEAARIEARKRLNQEMDQKVAKGHQRRLFGTDDEPVE